MRKSISLARMGLWVSASLFASSLMATEVKLESSDKASNDKLGSSVAVSGDYFLAGTPGDESDKGAAYLFKKNSSGTWEQNSKFTGSDSAASDTFGTSVGISGEYAIVGAPVNDSSKGAVYIFKDTSGTWGQDSKLTASDAAEGDKFGTSVGISGNYAIAGAPDDESSKGAAYILKNTDGTWAQYAKLTASDGAASDKFGSSVFILGDYVAVGAPDDESSMGAVYIFKNVNGTWVQSTKLTAGDAVAGDKFGTALYWSGDYLVIGAAGYSSGKGAAYVFKNTSDSWAQQTKLTASDGANGDGFGKSVSITGTIATVGAPDASSAAGKIYAYKKGETSWTETKLSFSTVSGKLGASHIVIDNKLYMGAPDYNSYQGAGLLADYTINDTSLLFTFNDESLSSFDGSVNTDSSSTGNYTASVSNSGTVSCEYIDGYSNLALKYTPNTSTDAKIGGLNWDWGKKIVLEAKIWKGSEASGSIDLVKNTTATSTPLRWYIDSDGKMKLSLNGGTDFFASTANAVLSDNAWNRLYAIIDLNKTSLSNTVKFYSNLDGGSASLNYFGNGSDGDVTISSNTTWDAGSSGDMLVKNINNFTVNSGVTLTIKTRKGCSIYVLGNTNIQGTIRVINSYSCDPASAGVPSGGLKIIRLRTGSTDTLSASDLSGCGSTVITAEGNQPAISGNGKIYTIPRAGANGAAAVTADLTSGYAGSAGSNLQSGGGGSGGKRVGTSSGAGAAGSCFSGGSGGGGCGYGGPAGAGGAYGANGGNGAGGSGNGGGGGAGGPSGGTGVPDGANGTAGAGGLLLLFVNGNLTIGASGAINLNGTAGGSAGTSYGAGGGGSGGGALLALYAGTLSNSGTISCASGAGGTAAHSGGGGGAGSYLIEQIGPGATPSLALASSGNVFQGAFASGTATLDANSATDNSIELVKRSAAFTLKTDFIKISTKGSYSSFETSDFQEVSGAASSYVDPNASASIIIDPTTMLRRVVNPPSDLAALNSGSLSPTYDNHPTTPSVFYGIFEITIKLDNSEFNGSVYVDYYIQKPEDNAFKKIGEKLTSKPASGDWIVKYYWNSRAESFQWTSTDAQPYRTDGPVRFKFSVR